MRPSTVHKWMGAVQPHKNTLIELLKQKPMTYRQIYKAVPEIPKPSVRRNMGELMHHNIVVKRGDGRWFLIASDDTAPQHP